ncbi:MAG: carbon storage regulator [Elusimicrobiales bacterium]|nr:carbon storage regulator [Elusimicrobiales bacterium]
MLVLTRKRGEKLIILDNIELTIIDLDKNKVKLGINAPKTIKIVRKELIEDLSKINKYSSQTNPLILNDIQKELKYFK